MTKYTAETNVVLLVISFEDFLETLEACFSLYAKDFTSILSRTSFFHNLSFESLERLGTYGRMHLYLKGEGRGLG